MILFARRKRSTYRRDANNIADTCHMLLLAIDAYVDAISQRRADQADRQMTVRHSKIDYRCCTCLEGTITLNSACRLAIWPCSALTLASSISSPQLELLGFGDLCLRMALSRSSMAM